MKAFVSNRLVTRSDDGYVERTNETQAERLSYGSFGR